MKVTGKYRRVFGSINDLSEVNSQVEKKLLEGFSQTHKEKRVLQTA
jgi:hypothetical protein